MYQFLQFNLKYHVASSTDRIKGLIVLYFETQSGLKERNFSVRDDISYSKEAIFKCRIHWLSKFWPD